MKSQKMALVHPQILRKSHIYNATRSFLAEQSANFSHVPSDEGQQLRDILADDNCFKGNQMQKAKSLMDALREKINSQLEKEKDNAAASVQNMVDRLVAMDDFAKLTPQEQGKIQAAFNDFTQELKEQKLIAVIRDRLRSFEEQEYARLLSEIDRLTAAKSTLRVDIENKKDKPATGSAKDTATEVRDPEPEYIHGRSIKVDFAKPMLTDAQDVEQYLTKMREAMLQEIKAGKRIQV